MTVHLVITVVADDRPGIVKTLSDAIKQNNGNWTESSMTRLGGMFAGILLIESDDAHQEALVAALHALEDSGIRVGISETENHAEGSQPVTKLRLVGNDRPGIVDEISAVLARHAINVEKLTTSVMSAPMSADELFHAELVAALPATMDLDKLRQALEGLSDDLTVEIDSH